MLKIMINGLVAVLPIDIEIVLKKRIPLTEERKEDSTYPFTLPIKANRHIFGNIDRIATNSVPDSYRAIVFFEPYTLLDGFAVITDISSDNVELYITTSQTEFFGLLDKIILRNMAWEVKPISGTVYDMFKKSTIENYPFVAAPLYDPTMVAIPTSRGQFDIMQYYINPWFFRPTADKIQVYIPFPRISAILNKIFELSGYKINKNYLDSIEDFGNILLICRRDYYVERPNYETPPVLLNRYLPDISAKEFIEEIEKKFGVVFIPHDNTKNIDIISFNSFESYPTSTIDITDEFAKELIDSKDIITGYTFMDESVDDPSYIYNNPVEIGFRTNEEKIECISKPVGTVNTDQGEMAIINFGNTGELAIDAPDRLKEFRIAIFNNNKLMSDTGNSGFSLKWVHLYEREHKRKTEYSMAKRFSIEMESLSNSLKIFQNTHRFFNGYTIVRNNRFVIEEQEIKVSKNNIVSFVLTGYPY